MLQDGGSPAPDLKEQTLQDDASPTRCHSLEMEASDYQMQDSEDEVSSNAGRSHSSEVNWGKFAMKIIIMVLTFLLLTGLLEHYANEQVTEVSERLMKYLGVPGLFVAVLIADGVPQPFTYVPLIFIAVKGGVSKPIVWTVCALASYLAAWMGYLIGWNIRRFQCTNAFMDQLTLKYPMVPQIMERRGATGVAIAALLPVPLAIATWTAGSFRIKPLPFAAAGLLRLPKITIFVLLSSCPDPDVVLKGFVAKEGVNSTAFLS